MKLPPAPQRNLTSELSEFDVWITPSLGEIRDSQRFEEELEKVASVFDALSAATNGFVSPATCSPEAITPALLALVNGKTEPVASLTLQGAAALLYLVTGKSDNNAKCQLPLHLRDNAKWAGFPTVGRGRSRTVGTGPLPRVLKADDYMALAARLAGDPEQQERLVREFVRFILSDERYVAQLWSLGRSYVSLKPFGEERSLITPLVIFKVRGSVSATGGHEPEGLLRERFDEWGLRRGVDYNESDVVVSSEGTLVAPPEDAGRAKTRAYDFVLPFLVEAWPQRIFIQSQFYAGDSGSVSHKNVDQTSASRSKLIERRPDALFVEYLDGAGYFSSLNGDLKSLLAMQNTHSFFQVRSAPVRLRRVLQEIGFLTPLELEHAIARTAGGAADVEAVLAGEGYHLEEIARSVKVATTNGSISKRRRRLILEPARRAIARRYFILDVIASRGETPVISAGGQAGFLLAPGYGPIYGMKLGDLLRTAQSLAPGFAHELGDSATFVSDIQWLEEQRWVMSS